MQIQASYQWIKEYLQTKESVETFAAKTTAAGNSVERMIREEEAYQDMVVGLVKEVKAHPNADKLKVATVDIGSKTVEIVCGGTNLTQDQRVVVALPGALVRWHGEGEPVQLKETAIRGVESYGMICAAEEVDLHALAGNEGEILDITDLTEAAPGTAIAEALGLDDVLLDIEVTSNRPDCKSIIGQAREGSAVTEGAFTWEPPEMPTTDTPISIDVQAPDVCPAYSALRIEGVNVGASPWWLQKRLIQAGFRPINVVVDVTNYVLHEYGHPLHAFDASAIDGEEVVVRYANEGETIQALDQEEYTLTKDMLVIADAKKPIAIAGVIGGLDSGTTESTTDVILESATFDPVSVRRTARALNVQTDASTLFDKGLSTQATGPALARAAQLITELAGGTIVAGPTRVQTHAYKAPVYPFDPEASRGLMGIEMNDANMIHILEDLGFTVDATNQPWQITVPYWRDHDIEAPVDFTEEIARVHGYDAFPSVMPTGEIPLVKEDPSLGWERRIKQVLRGAGLTEVYSYSFVSEDGLRKFGFDPSGAVRIRNPLSKDHSHMRPSLIPSMLASIEQNQAIIPSADLFELSTVHIPKKNELPDHPWRLLLARYEEDGAQAFLRTKGVLERLLRELGIRHWQLDRNVSESHWHPTRSARVLVDDQVLGTIGEVHPDMAAAFGVDVRVSLVDLDASILFRLATDAKSYTPIPSYPSVKRDLAFVIDARAPYADVRHALRDASSLLELIELFDVYEGEHVEKGMKSMAVHLRFRAPDRTLDAEEVEEEIQSLRAVLQDAFNATMRS